MRALEQTASSNWPAIPGPRAATPAQAAPPKPSHCSHGPETNGKQKGDKEAMSAKQVFGVLLGDGDGDGDDDDDEEAEEDK